MSRSIFSFSIFAAQTREILTLSRGQVIVTYAGINVGLRHPVDYCLHARLKLCANSSGVRPAFTKSTMRARNLPICRRVSEPATFAVHQPGLAGRPAYT